MVRKTNLKNITLKSSCNRCMQIVSAKIPPECIYGVLWETYPVDPPPTKLVNTQHWPIDSSGSPSHKHFCFSRMSKYTNLSIIQSFSQFISCLNIVVGCQILIYWRRDHETLDCTASVESENTSKKFTSHFLNIIVKP